jgi:hypothetical protein
MTVDQRRFETVPQTSMSPGAAGKSFGGNSMPTTISHAGEDENPDELLHAGSS